jgi:oligoendopeptidase F
MENNTAIKTEWDLEKYFYSSLEDPQLDKDIEKYKNTVSEFRNRYKDKIASLNESEFIIYFRDLDYMSTLLDKVYMYLHFLQTLDMQDAKVQKKIMKVEKISSELEEELVFIYEEYKKLGADFFYKLSKNPKFEEYKLFTKDIGDSIKYLLSEKEEILINRFEDVTSNFNKIYDEHTTALEFEIDGKKYLESEILSMRSDSDREVRKKANEALAKEYNKLITKVVLGRIYASVCEENVLEKKTRGYNSVMTSFNESEHLSDDTVDVLLECVTNKFYLYHRFLDIKKKFLGYDELHIYDLLASIDLGGGEIPEISFEEGWNKYISIIEKIDPKMAQYSKDMLDGGRMSVFPKKGKQGGAYANYTKTIPSFVMLNWNNKLDDLTTMAHELGHAFHGELQKKQNALSYNTPLVLSETASIFTETLLFQNILKEIEDKNKKKEMIVEYLDGIFSTVFRQIQYVNFEKRCHNSFLNNEPLTYVEFDEMWSEETKKLLGNNVGSLELISSRWSQIPHIFMSPFYCYSYAFGNILSLNLIQMYQEAENKQEFLDKYHEFLSAGGSETPEELMKRIFGLNLDEKFYDTAFKVVENFIGELEK